MTFKKEDLEKIVTSCIAMAALDGEVTKDELRPIAAFVESRWQSDYGDINHLSAKALENTHKALDADSLFESIKEVASSLAGSLDDEQKESVLKLLKIVLHADDEGHEFEHGLYNIFVNQFHG